MEIELFAGVRLETELERTFRAVVLHIARIPANQILAADDEYIVEGLLRDARAECPELLTDEIQALPMIECSEPVGLYKDGSHITRQVPRYRIVVPFTGHTHIFRSQPSRASLTRPVAFDLREDELELSVDGPHQAEQVRHAFDTQIHDIGQYLAWARADCDTHNRRLAADVPGLVRRRREEVQRFRETEAQVGYPLRLRNEAGAASVPLTRHTALHLSPGASRGGTSEPRWVLHDADYQEALRVLDYWRDSLERAPSIADQRGEEEIRDLLVAGLNSVFKGAAAGEVFNGDGKTDILIRHDRVNVFIGECKFWDGETSLTEALDQLFRYAVWRDTKTAVLLFIRNHDVSAVINTALSTVRAHGNFTADAVATGSSRYNFVMHATGDPHQRIAMALLPFALRPKSPRRGRS
ncbi:hypothetical protein [Catenuloplanes japonicus]|uniref:hypothetical protein n=1 Tax=Catenuloplanes japonicus TaxID=33876 RepID=UPI0006908407|nr:hypothetical protein [Catenuloplanes japonicus]